MLRGGRRGPRAYRRDENDADPPDGKIEELAANIVSNPEREMREDLENFAKKIEWDELNLGGSGAQAR